MEKKNLGRNQAQSIASSPLANEQRVYDYDLGSIIGQKSDWIVTIRIISISIWLKFGVMQVGSVGISGDGCRVNEAFTGESLIYLIYFCKIDSYMQVTMCSQ